MMQAVWGGRRSLPVEQVEQSCAEQVKPEWAYLSLAGVGYWGQEVTQTTIYREH